MRNYAEREKNSLAIMEYRKPLAGVGLDAIAAGPNGALWFTEAANESVRRTTPSGVFTLHRIVPAGLFTSVAQSISLPVS
jgi:streptogramin lyase